MPSVSKYMSSILNALTIQEENQLLRKIHQYGTPQDYSKAIKMIQSKQQTKLKNKLNRGKPLPIPDPSPLVRQHAIIPQDVDDEKLVTIPSKIISPTPTPTSKPEPTNTELVDEAFTILDTITEHVEKIPLLEKPDTSNKPIKQKQKCPICGALVYNPNSARHIASKRHQKALAKQKTQ